MSAMIPFHNKALLRTNGFDDFYNMLDGFFNDAIPYGRDYAYDSFKIDVTDNEEEYLVDAELPGVNKDEINLEMDDGKLLITVNREEQSEEKKKNYIHRERRFGSMQRMIYLADAKSEGITAKFEEGLLKITIPKEKENEKNHKIMIQ